MKIINLFISQRLYFLFFCWAVANIISFSLSLIHIHVAFALIIINVEYFLWRYIFEHIVTAYVHSERIETIVWHLTVQIIQNENKAIGNVCLLASDSNRSGVVELWSVLFSDPNPLGQEHIKYKKKYSPESLPWEAVVSYRRWKI